MSNEIKVLSYVRPTWFGWVKSILSNSRLSNYYISEHKIDSVNWLGEKFYLNRCLTPPHHTLVNGGYNDIILRCRYLRNILRDEAIKSINAIWTVIEHELLSIDPDIILTITVDSYIIDILCRLCDIKKIPVLGLTGCFVNNYFRLSQYGEYYYERDITIDEVDTVFNMLCNPTYAPNFFWRSPTINSLFKRWFLVKVKKFYIQYKQFRDPLNYDYQTVINNYAADVSSFKNIFVNFDNINIADLKNKRVCYIPLHCYPEATVDYWTRSLNLVDYYSSLLELIQKLCHLNSVDLILIKEHPGAYGTRDRALFDEMRKNKKVKLIFDISSRDVLQASDMVFTWNGTVAFEGALMGKPSFCFGSPFYFHEKFMNKCKSVDDVLRILTQNNYKKGCLSEKDQKELIRHVLSACIPGKFLQKGYQSPDNIQVVSQQILNLIYSRVSTANYLKEYKVNSKCVE